MTEKRFDCAAGVSMSTSMICAFVLNCVPDFDLHVLNN